MKSRLKLTAALILTATLLSACGIKPHHVAAPQGDDKDQFPHAYPSKETISK